MVHRVGRQIRVLMLGWEYPPRFAGGLGKACQGLAQAMARQGTHVFFVLPTFPQKVTETRLEVVGAEQWVAEGVGLNGEEQERIVPEAFGEGGVGIHSPVYPGFSSSSFLTVAVNARLFPYGQPPEGLIPNEIHSIFHDQSDLETVTSFKQHRTQSRAKKNRKNWVRFPYNKKNHPGISLVEGQASAEVPNGGVEGALFFKEIYGKNLWSEMERYRIRVRQLAEVHQVDLVHAHDWMTFPAAFEFQRVTGVPVFLHVHATEYDRSGEQPNPDVFQIERRGFERAQHVFAVSRYTAGILENLYGVPSKKISVIYNAPEDDWVVDPTRRSFENTPSQIVFLGRLTFQKGPDHFLKAAALVASVHPDARFVLCGSGDLLEKLRGMAHRFGIEDRVHFTGFVEPKEVEEILQRSKVLVMPSVSEPFGLVALEAIRNGIPVILSKQSGVKEILQRALQVDFWDHEKLADQILAAIRLPDLSHQLVQEGQVQVQELSWEKSAKKTIEVYRKSLSAFSAQVASHAGAHCSYRQNRPSSQSGKNKS